MKFKLKNGSFIYGTYCPADNEVIIEIVEALIDSTIILDPEQLETLITKLQSFSKQINEHLKGELS